MPTKTETKDGGAAFPSKANNTDKFEGMSLRDYFAAKAMQGELACQQPGYEFANTPEGYSAIAKKSYAIADAMLLERSKQNE